MGRAAKPALCLPEGGRTFLYLSVNIKVQKQPLVQYCNLTPPDDWRDLPAFSRVSDVNDYTTINARLSSAALLSYTSHRLFRLMYDSCEAVTLYI